MTPALQVNLTHPRLIGAAMEVLTHHPELFHDQADRDELDQEIHRAMKQRDDAGPA